MQNESDFQTDADWSSIDLAHSSASMVQDLTVSVLPLKYLRVLAVSYVAAGLQTHRRNMQLERCHHHHRHHHLKT